VRQSFENYVRLKIVQNLVVTEVWELGQVQNGLLLLNLIIFVVVHLNQTLSDEVHFLDVTLVADDSLSRRVDPAVHRDDKLIGETSFAFLEEMIERSFELFEHTRVLDQVCLHFWSNLLVELELFDNEVEVI